MKSTLIRGGIAPGMEKMSDDHKFAITDPKLPTFRLRMCDGLYFDLVGRMPNCWHRRLARLFFGWKFEQSDLQ